MHIWTNTERERKRRRGEEEEEEKEEEEEGRREEGRKREGEWIKLKVKKAEFTNRLDVSCEKKKEEMAAIYW